MTALASLRLDPIGSLRFTGGIRFDADGLVIDATFSIAAGAGFGAGIDLDSAARCTFQLNTTGKVKNARRHAVDPGFRFRIQASVDFLGLASASGVVEISINQNKFELSFDVAINLGPFTVEARPASPASTRTASCSASTSRSTSTCSRSSRSRRAASCGSTRRRGRRPGRRHDRHRLPARSCGRAQAPRGHQARGVVRDPGRRRAESRSAPAARRSATTRTRIGHRETIGPGDWFICSPRPPTSSASRTMSASGWIDSKGHFGLRLHGELVLGSRCFGLVGEFNFSRAPRGGGVIDPNNRRRGRELLTSASASRAEVDARLFGITFASIGLSAEVEARGAGGEVDLIATVTVRIKILFVKVSKTVSFKIGTVQLPRPVYLAGNGPSTTDRHRALWRGATDAAGALPEHGPARPAPTRDRLPRPRRRRRPAVARSSSSSTSAARPATRRCASRAWAARRSTPASPRSTRSAATATTDHHRARACSSTSTSRAAPARDVIVFNGSGDA